MRWEEEVQNTSGGDATNYCLLRVEATVVAEKNLRPKWTTEDTIPIC